MTRKEERERAGLYYANNLDDVKPTDEFSRNLCIALGQAYIKGAKWADEHPQKGLIDINKACEYFKNLGYSEDFINDFIKAMEK
jgi:hypothetical protein